MQLHTVNTPSKINETYMVFCREVEVDMYALAHEQVLTNITDLQSSHLTSLHWYRCPGNLVAMIVYSNTLFAHITTILFIRPQEIKNII